MQLKDRNRQVGPGARHPSFDANFLTVVLVSLLCLIVLIYVLFPRHTTEQAVGPGATSSPAVSGAGPGAPPTVPPANPGGAQPR